MAESDLCHGNGAAKHKLRRQAENKTGICGKPRLTQLRGWSDSRDAPIGQEKFIFRSWPFVPTWETWCGGGNGERQKTRQCVLLPMLPICFIKTNKHVARKNFRNALIRAEAVGCDASSLISGFYLVGIWKMLPRPCLVCFHFSWGGERRSHFVPNCWIISANEESHPPSLDQTQQRRPVMKH